MAGLAEIGRQRITWTVRLLLCATAAFVVLAGVELVLMRNPSITASMMTDVVDTQTPATLAAKIRYLGAQKGKRVVLMGDSLVGGQTMRQDGEGRGNTLGADLQQRFDDAQLNGATVLNLGINAILPSDMETLVDAVLPLRLDAIVIEVSLRSFSRDFPAPDSINSRRWLVPGLRFRSDGSVQRLSDKPGLEMERWLLNHWTAYRLRDHIQGRFMGGQPRDFLEALRARLVGKGPPGASLAADPFQLRGRYGTVSLDTSNPQYAAWIRMLDKLKAAGQKTVVFYATERPGLLPDLIDPDRYHKLTEQLSRSVMLHGDLFSYLGPNRKLTSDMFFDHVHVDAEGNRTYGDALFGALEPMRRALKQSLELRLTPFIETVSAERNELVRTDLSAYASISEPPETARFDLKGYPVLSLEVRSSEPNNVIMFLYHWWDKQSEWSVVRDSYHMLRASVVWKDDYPASVVKALGSVDENFEYIDVFAGVPSRFGAVQTALYVQELSHPLKPRVLTLYGHAIDRTPLVDPDFKLEKRSTPSEEPNASPDVANVVKFGVAAGTDISGRGVRFQLDDVAAVFTIRANHDLERHSAAAEYLLGNMVPQVIGYRTGAGDYRTLAFSNADLVRFNYEPGDARLLVDAHAYDFRERSTRGSTTFPNKDGRRHPNLGLVSKLPAQQISITHSRSRMLAFPLWQPNGALAALAVTEHADFVGVDQDMITMYGQRSPAVVEGKGFLGNRIPLTKTIFPSGKPYPFTSRTRSSPTVGEFVQPTVTGDPVFLQMLRNYRSGHHDVEIGIHCVGTAQLNAERTTSHVAEALAATAEFKPVTWVDHGGRECLWEAGWDPTSEHYIVPLLRQHGFKYVNMLGDKYGRLSMIADNQPSNLLFYSVGLDDDITDSWRPIVFNTMQVDFAPNNFTQEHLQQIVRSRGLINLHAYLPYEGVMVERREDGTTALKANPLYNEQLANIAAAKRSGDLYLATSEKLNDFMWKVRGLHVHTAGRRIEVTNSDKTVLTGLTLGSRVMEGAPFEPTLANATPEGKRFLDGVNYIWFDLKP